MQELKRIRNERGWSQQRLADESGVNKATINQVEQGKRSPTIETLEKLASALGVEIGDFFPKAQPPLPLPDSTEQRRGVVELAEEAGTLYSAYEGLGRVLASAWEDDLKEWDEKIPEGSVPDTFDFGRLLEWSLTIGVVKNVYEGIAQETNYPQREEFKDTLRLIGHAQERALEKLKRAFEPAKTYTEFREIWKANDMDSVLANVERDV